MELKLMTYNIASGHNLKCERNFDFAVDVIKQYAPDVVGLNEVGKKLPEGITSHAGYLAEKTGLNGYFAEALNISGGPYGNALLSRFAITDAETIHIPDAPKVDDEYYEHRCLLVSKLSLPDGRKINYLVSHFGLAKGERVNAVKTVCDILDKLTGPTIFGGDLNMTPDDPRIAPLYQRMTSVDDTLYTFPSDKPDRKIDYIFVTPEFKVKDVFVPDTQNSDHAPLCANVEF